MPLLIQSLHEIGFCVSISKAVQTNKPLPARWTDGGMLDIRAALDRIAMPPQRFQKRIIGQAPSQRCVYVTTDKVTDCTAAALFCVPCSVGSALPIRFNHGVSALPADLIRNAAQIVEIAFEITPVLFAVHE